MPKIGIKSALFGYFWARLFEKSLAMFEISKLECVKNGFLTHLVNFGPLFFKDPSLGPLCVPHGHIILYGDILSTRLHGKGN